MRREHNRFVDEARWRKSRYVPPTNQTSRSFPEATGKNRQRRSLPPRPLRLERRASWLRLWRRMKDQVQPPSSRVASRAPELHAPFRTPELKRGPKEHAPGDTSPRPEQALLYPKAYRFARNASAIPNRVGHAGSLSLLAKMRSRRDS